MENPQDDEVRASDADRDRAVDMLQAATADGRVSAGELDQRLEQVYGARSRGELAAIVGDLRPARRPDAVAKDTGVLSDFIRKGRWQVGARYRGTAVVSSGLIDLRDAEFTGPETTIHVSSWVGMVYVVVPEDAEVHVAGTGILGGFKRDRESTGFPAHTITITGRAVCGNVYVVYEPPVTWQRRLRRRERTAVGS